VRCAGNRAPSGETEPVEGTPSGSPRRQDRIPRDPSQARPRSAFGTTDAIDRSGSPFGVTQRNGCAAVFGLQASRTGGGCPSGLHQHRPLGARQAENLPTAPLSGGGGHPDGLEPSWWNDLPGGLVGALRAADIWTNRSKAHGSIGPDRVETP
jgi:hypothetical protein